MDDDEFVFWVRVAIWWRVGSRLFVALACVLDGTMMIENRLDGEVQSWPIVIASALWFWVVAWGYVNEARR